MDQFIRDTMVACATIAITIGTFLTPDLIPVAILFLCKWITGRSSCVYGYLECKLRGCKREQGYINHMVEGVYDIGNENILFVGIVAFGLTLAIRGYIPK